MYKTIQKTILYLFSTSLGELLAIAGSFFAGLPLPLVPVQILWLNLVTDPFMGFALALEPKESNLLAGDFKRPNRYLIDRTMVVRGVIMAVAMMLGTFFLLGFYERNDYVRATTMALTVLSIFQWFNAWNCRSEDRSIFGVNPLSNPYLIWGTLAVSGLQVAAVYAPALQGILHTTALSPVEWIWAVGVAATIVLAEEARKIFVKLFRAS